jgi:hypothetical protein
MANLCLFFFCLAHQIINEPGSFCPPNNMAIMEMILLKKEFIYEEVKGKEKGNSNSTLPPEDRAWDIHGRHGEL